MASKRVNIRAILADPDLRRKLMVSTIQATQAREGIETTEEQAERAYYVVSEGERATFFELERFKGGKRGEQDRRHEMYLRAFRPDVTEIRWEVPRRDFAAIEGAPLAYRRLGLVAHIFREASSVQPRWGTTAQGLATTDDPRWLRYHWEVPVQDQGRGKSWVSFAKGGDFARFYYDNQLVIRWKQDGRELKEEIRHRYGSEGKRIYGQTHYFTQGLTWPYRSQRGFGPRILEGSGIQGHVGHSFFPNQVNDLFFLLGVFTSTPFEFILGLFSAFGKYEVGMVRGVPCPEVSVSARKVIEEAARYIYERKSSWDQGNEISTKFLHPWLLISGVFAEVVDGSVSTRLEHLLTYESAINADIQHRFACLNQEVYRLYGIPDAGRVTMEGVLGARPPEILWSQMEGKSFEQKRMEHVWRLLSYAVKRVLESDADGIVPFGAVNGEVRLVDRVRHEIGALFPGRDVNQVEVEIVNELKRTVKGYRKCGSIDEWLSDAFFEYHCDLYKRRPIFWHLASAQGTSPCAFGALVHYHRFDRNRLAKLRANYLRDAIEEFRREAGLADKAGRTDDRIEWQAKVEEAQALDKKLQLIQEGHHEGAEGGDRDYRILTPWKKPNDRPKGWAPDIDDGVKVNIEPFEKAGVLRIGKVT